MTEELKPCPKCFAREDRSDPVKGSLIDYEIEDRSDSWFIECLECGLRSGTHITKEGAKKDWNRRAVPPEIKELMDLLAVAPSEWRKVHIGSTMYEARLLLSPPSKERWDKAIEAIRKLYNL
jgi:hypothetical protein